MRHALTIVASLLLSTATASASCITCEDPQAGHTTRLPAASTVLANLGGNVIIVYDRTSDRKRVSCRGAHVGYEDGWSPRVTYELYSWEECFIVK